MFSVGESFRLICTLLIFYAGIQLGKRRSDASISNHCEPRKHEIRPQVGSQTTSNVIEDVPDCPIPKAHSAGSKKGDICPLFNKNVATLRLAKATAPADLWPHLHHAGSPAKWNFYLSSKEDNWNTNEILEAPCQEVYLTRTGSRQGQPNKCVAVAIVPNGYESVVQQSHRVGVTAGTLDQYQKDYPRAYGKDFDNEEKDLTLPLLEDYDRLVKDFLSKMGSPIDANGQRRLAIVMVANKGVMDLLLNFMCSAEEIHLDLKSIIVFVGDPEYVALIENMGANAIYDPSLGSMPAHAANQYLDKTFARMMWYKTTSVYLSLVSGFNVLFQDVDLVWLKDPFKYFLSLDQDMIFMDDGQKSPRYTPYYVNSGFYFVKHNERTLYLFEKMMKCGASEIGKSHSHQQVLIRHIAESHHLYGLQVYVLDMKLFPSGQVYHENKKLVKKIQEKTYRPYVFHMCWTTNREDKLVYFKDMGLWYLAENQPVCESKGDSMLKFARIHGPRKSIRDKCCRRELYWPAENEQEQEQGRS